MTEKGVTSSDITSLEAITYLEYDKTPQRAEPEDCQPRNTVHRTRQYDFNRRKEETDLPIPILP